MPDNLQGPVLNEIARPIGQKVGEKIFLTKETKTYKEEKKPFQ